MKLRVVDVEEVEQREEQEKIDRRSRRYREGMGQIDYDSLPEGKLTVVQAEREYGVSAQVIYRMLRLHLIENYGDKFAKLIDKDEFEAAMTMPRRRKNAIGTNDRQPGVYLGDNEYLTTWLRTVKTTPQPDGSIHLCAVGEPEPLASWPLETLVDRIRRQQIKVENPINVLRYLAANYEESNPVIASRLLEIIEYATA